MKGYSLDHIDNVSDYLDYREKLRGRREKWREFIKGVMSENDFRTRQELGSVVGFTGQTVGYWLDGRAMPATRDSMIKVGFGLGYDCRKMDDFLVEYGFGKLYVGNIEDSVYVYALSNPKVMEMYCLARNVSVYDCCRELIGRVNAKRVEKEKMEVLGRPTRVISDGLRGISDFSELERFIEDKAGFFVGKYQDMYDSLSRYMEINSSSRGRYTVNKLVTENGWPRSFQNMAYEISNRKWVPDRMKLIAICLHLKTDLDELNEVLEQAHMEPLVSESLLESALIFALRDIHENNDEFFKKDGRKNLCDKVAVFLRMLMMLDSYGCYYDPYDANARKIGGVDDDFVKMVEYLEVGTRDEEEEC